MKITINGQPRTLDSTLNIEALLRAENMVDMKVAVAVNENFIPRSQWPDTFINDNDRVEILAPMQGG